MENGNKHIRNAFELKVECAYPPKEDLVLPGKNCGACGYRTCDELQDRLAANPEWIKRCIFLSENQVQDSQSPISTEGVRSGVCPSAGTCGSHLSAAGSIGGETRWLDSLGREFDFLLENFPEDPGPREIILPHNPMITRELEIQRGDILIGRPLGMSCGCPITHCGVVMDVDQRTGVMTWCVTGPLNPRQKGYKDLGYYIAEGYEGMVRRARIGLRIGERYYFQPHMCMLQWRHSGLLNYLNHTPDGDQVRLEGLWIG